MFYEKTKHLNADHFLRQYYIRLKYQYRKMIQQAKCDKIRESIENSDNKTKTVWKIINDHRPKSRKENTDIILVNSEGKSVTEPKKVCDTLNAHFVGVGDGIKKPVSHDKLDIINNRLNSSSFFLTPVNENEIKSIISGMKSKNSAGVDELSPKMLKAISEFVTAPLCHLVNSSFVEGKFPSVLKLTMVRPILKKGNEGSCDNYRPISLISTVSKIFEKAVLNRLCTFLETRQILYQNQHGFVKNRSTTSAILSLINGIVTDLDSGQRVSGLFFDLSKAFDMVNHDLLLMKMCHQGIRGVALDWFASYLEKREQFVVIPDIDDSGYLRRYASSRALIKRGVPQGSVLGPTLFLLFINNLPNSVSSAKICLFADDTSLTLSSPCNESLEQIVFSESNSLLQWFQNNQLILNADKTQLLNFYISNRTFGANDGLNILLGDSIVYSSQEVKFLGLTLDANLNYHKHIESVTKKVSTGVFILRTLKKFVSSEVLLSAYYGTIFPYLSYAVPVWGSESQRTLLLFRLQKKAIRVIFSLPRGHSCREIFRTNNILTFPSIYILETLLFVRKNISVFSSPSSNRYTLRNTNDISIPRHSTSFFQKQFQYNAIKLYNSLPASLKIEQDHRAFKRGVKRMLLDEVVYSVRNFLAGSH